MGGLQQDGRGGRGYGSFLGGQTPRQCAIADLDNDGLLDAAAVDPYYDVMWTLMHR